MCGAIVANTSLSAWLMGLEGEVGVIAPGKLADIVIALARQRSRVYPGLSRPHRAAQRGRGGRPTEGAFSPQRKRWFVDSLLEESGFELLVPPPFRSWPGRPRDRCRPARRESPSLLERGPTVRFRLPPAASRTNLEAGRCRTSILSHKHWPSRRYAPARPDGPPDQRRHRTRRRSSRHLREPCRAADPRVCGRGKRRKAPYEIRASVPPRGTSPECSGAERDFR